MKNDDIAKSMRKKLHQKCSLRICVKAIQFYGHTHTYALILFKDYILQSEIVVRLEAYILYTLYTDTN